MHKVSPPVKAVRCCTGHEPLGSVVVRLFGNAGAQLGKDFLFGFRTGVKLAQALVGLTDIVESAVVLDGSSPPMNTASSLPLTRPTPGTSTTMARSVHAGMRLAHDDSANLRCHATSLDSVALSLLMEVAEAADTADADC